MSTLARESKELQAIAERLKRTAEQSRPTFTDGTRAQFDHRVIDTVTTGIRDLATRVDELDATLVSALRLLD